MYEAEATNKNIKNFKYFYKTHVTWVFVTSCSWKILLEFVYKPR